MLILLFGFLPQVLEHVRFMLQTGGLTDIYTERQTESQDMAQTESVISKGIHNDDTILLLW